MKVAMAAAAASVDWLLARRRTSVTSKRLIAIVKALISSLNFSLITLGATEEKTLQNNGNMAYNFNSLSDA